jgi:hypothetical protein
MTRINLQTIVFYFQSQLRIADIMSEETTALPEAIFMEQNLDPESVVTCPYNHGERLFFGFPKILTRNE